MPPEVSLPDSLKDVEAVRSVRTPAQLDYEFTAGDATTRFLRGITQKKIIGQRANENSRVYVPPRGADPELGYRLRRSAWGRGLATEGSVALVRAAFTDLGAARVVAETMAVHLASRRVMEKAGLRLVRTFHQDWPYPIPGDEQGDVEYAVTRTEWLAAQR